MDCCSDNAISFHYVTPNQMYVMDYLIYNLKPYGIKMKMSRVPALTPNATDPDGDRSVKPLNLS